MHKLIKRVDQDEPPAGFEQPLSLDLLVGRKLLAFCLAFCREQKRAVAMRKPARPFFPLVRLSMRSNLVINLIEVEPVGGKLLELFSWPSLKVRRASLAVIPARPRRLRSSFSVKGCRHQRCC